ncbi:MAG: DMT family transporter [Acidimicrobiia bacterium]
MGGMGYLGVAIVSEVFGTSMLRLSEGFRELVPSLLALAGWGVSLFFFALALRSVAVGTAYAIWSGVGTALLVGIAWVFFDQRLDLAAFAGVGLIIAGVVFIQVVSEVEIG